MNLTEKVGTHRGLDQTSRVMNSSDGVQFLTFLMGETEYGVDILRVQEIRGWENTTPIPNAPHHVKGVINLRGTIVPIIDLREKFSFDSLEYGPLTVVIVLRVINEKKGERIMGIVVDAVSDVYQIKSDEIKSAPDLGADMTTEFIVGLVDVKESMVILLDIDELLGMDNVPELTDTMNTIQNTH